MSVSRIAAVATASPPYVVDQADAKRIARTLFADLPERAFDRLAPVFDNVHIERRHLCAPPEWFAEPHPFAERNERYQRWATDLGVAAATAALDQAGVAPSDVGSIVFVSTTGLATPSLDARLMARLGLPARHTHRQAVFGRGCAGGAVGLGLAADRCQLDPARATLLVVVELCSLTFRRTDASTANLVSSALFADGAAAAVLAPDHRAGDPVVIGQDGVTWPDTEDLMGWRFGDDGMSVTLAKSIPALVRREFRQSFDDACACVGVTATDVRHHLVHPGSPVVLDAVAEALDLAPDALARSHDVLRDHGNMSAATVLFILQRFLADGCAAPGDIAMVSAMGPGFSAEHVALRW